MYKHKVLLLSFAGVWIQLPPPRVTKHTNSYEIVQSLAHLADILQQLKSLDPSPGGSFPQQDSIRHNATLSLVISWFH